MRNPKKHKKTNNQKKSYVSYKEYKMAEKGGYMTRSRTNKIRKYIIENPRNWEIKTTDKSVLRQKNIEKEKRIYRYLKTKEEFDKNIIVKKHKNTWPIMKKFPVHTNKKYAYITHIETQWDGTKIPHFNTNNTPGTDSALILNEILKTSYPSGLYIKMEWYNIETELDAYKRLATNTQKAIIIETSDITSNFNETFFLRSMTYHAYDVERIYGIDEKLLNTLIKLHIYNFAHFKFENQLYGKHGLIHGNILTPTICHLYIQNAYLKWIKNNKEIKGTYWVHDAKIYGHTEGRDVEIIRMIFNDQLELKLKITEPFKQN